MFIEKELSLLTQKIGTDELLDKIFRTYFKEMREEYFYDVEKEYQNSRQVLEQILEEEQEKSLKMIEELFKENMKYCVGFGFKKGLYFGFEQYFKEESTKDPFDEYVHDDLLTMPNMEKHREYYERRRKIKGLVEKIKENLSEDDSEQMIIFFCTFGERELGVLRHSFYIGYRYALDIVEEIDLLGTAKIADKILYTEYKLGFTMTGKEREQLAKQHTKEVKNETPEAPFFIHSQTHRTHGGKCSN